MGGWVRRSEEVEGVESGWGDPVGTIQWLVIGQLMAIDRLVIIFINA